MHEKSRAVEEILGSRERLLSVCVFKIEKQANVQDTDRRKKLIRDELSKDNSKVKWRQTRIYSRPYVKLFLTLGEGLFPVRQDESRGCLKIQEKFKVLKEECLAIKISKLNIQYEWYASFSSLGIMACSVYEYS